MLKVRPGLLLLVAAALVAACGPASQPVPEGAASGDGQPRYGGTFLERVEADPYDWDISFAGKSNPNQDGIGISYNPLLRFNSGPGVEFTDSVLMPELAEKWEVSPDAKTFTYHLRKGVRYHDVPPLNGRELTSADVKWTMEYRTRTGELKDKKLPKGQIDFMFDYFDRVETPDPYTAVIHFKQPFAPFVNYSASRWSPIMPREVFEQDGHLKDRIVGTGPYMIDTTASQKGTRWVFKKNPNYFEEGKPYMDEIRWLVLPEETSAFAAFQVKQVDRMESMAYASFEQVKKGTPAMETQQYFATNAQQIRISQLRPGPLRDLRIREAISLAIDRDVINQTLGGGQGLWAIPAAPANAYSQEETRKLIKQDLNEAKRLVVEAGYPNGTPVMEWPIPRNEEQAIISLFELIQAQIKPAGINVELKPQDLADQRAGRRNGTFDFDGSVGGTGQLNSDLDSLIYGKFHSKVSGNYMKLNDPDLDKLLEQSRQETDPAKRKDIFHRISMRILEMKWGIDTIYVPRWDAWHPHLKGYHNHYTDRPTYRNAWLEK